MLTNSYVNTLLFGVYPYICLVVLLIGSNDLVHERTAPDAVAREIAALAAVLQDAGKRVALTTLPPVRGPFADRNQAIRAVNERLRALTGPRLLLVDLHAALVDASGQLDERYTLDGLHLSLRNDVSLFHRQFDYSAFNGLAQLPVSDRGWLLIQGGGGTVGHAFIEIGGKALLRGNGAPGSLFLRGTIGYAALYENPATSDLRVGPNGAVSLSERSFGGPLIGIGLEWRR